MSLSMDQNPSINVDRHEELKTYKEIKRVSALRCEFCEQCHTGRYPALDGADSLC